MRSSAARAYSLLFFFSGATGLVYELLWVRILYQTFGSTIQSITTVVAAYMGGLGLGAWLGRLSPLNPPGAAAGRAPAGFSLTDRAAIPPSLSAPAALTPPLGAAALARARPLEPSPAAPSPTARSSDRTRRVALTL